MLGREIVDSDMVESGEERRDGLGLLDVTTIFERRKTTRQVKARVLGNEGLLEGLRGQEVEGYEIHMGHTTGNNTSPLFSIPRKTGVETSYSDGVAAPGGLTFGSYMHGLFDNDNFRHAFLSNLRQRKGLSPLPGQPLPGREQQYDRLADIVRRSLNLKLVYEICGLARQHGLGIREQSVFYCIFLSHSRQ